MLGKRALRTVNPKPLPSFFVDGEAHLAAPAASVTITVPLSATAARNSAAVPCFPLPDCQNTDLAALSVALGFAVGYLRVWVRYSFQLGSIQGTRGRDTIGRREGLWRRSSLAQYLRLPSSSTQRKMGYTAVSGAFEPDVHSTLAPSSHAEDTMSS